MYLHSKNGQGYEIHFITDGNVKSYIPNISDYFYKLQVHHQADYVRVILIEKYGGIWLDSDTLILDKLDSLFDLTKEKDGFFIKENNKIICNGVFGSKKQTPLMKYWKSKMIYELENNFDDINWSTIGSVILRNIDENYYDNYKIFDGLDNIYPINWTECIDEYIMKPYEEHKNIIREYQPLIILVNSVYKKLENFDIDKILNGKLVINYFINKSFENMNLKKYDFIEIGTSNFDTLIQEADDNSVGLSVDAVKYYIDSLPNKKNVKKINKGISNSNTTLDVYYIPEDIIDEHKLQPWFKGCNCIDRFHPLHIKHNVEKYCKIENVEVITPQKLFYSYNVGELDYLKIDTEGHDCIILEALFDYLKFLSTKYYPKKILFETNENSEPSIVDNIIFMYLSIGYKLESRGYDTILVY